MEKNRTITKTYTVEDITCDICGEKFNKEDKDYNLIPFFSIGRIGKKDNGNWFSYYDEFEVAKKQDICKKCGRKISDEFCKELRKLEEKYNDLKVLKEIAHDH